MYARSPPRRMMAAYTLLWRFAMRVSRVHSGVAARNRVSSAMSAAPWRPCGRTADAMAAETVEAIAAAALAGPPEGPPAGPPAGPPKLHTIADTSARANDISAIGYAPLGPASSITKLAPPSRAAAAAPVASSAIAPEPAGSNATTTSRPKADRARSVSRSGQAAARAPPGLNGDGVGSRRMNAARIASPRAAADSSAAAAPPPRHMYRSPSSTAASASRPRAASAPPRAPASPAAPASARASANAKPALGTAGASCSIPIIMHDDLEAPPRIPKNRPSLKTRGSAPRRPGASALP